MAPRDPELLGLVAARAAPDIQPVPERGVIRRQSLAVAAKSDAAFYTNNVLVVMLTRLAPTDDFHRMVGPRRGAESSRPWLRRATPGRS